MSDNSNKHLRRSIRLKGYDYSLAGVYFVTMVSHQCATLFGDVVAGEVQLNAIGRIIESAWLALEDRFPIIALDEFVIMPDHIHAIIFIVGATPVEVNSVGATLVVARSRSCPRSRGQPQWATTRDAPTRGYSKV